MAVINHIDKFEYATNIRLAILRAANYICYDTSIKHKDETYLTVTPTERVNEWWKITNKRIITPLAMNRAKMLPCLLDEDTFTYEDEAIAFAGGFVFGDFTSAKLPIFDPDNYNHIGSDMLGSSIACAMEGYMSRAYAYLRFYQAFISLGMNKSIRDSLQFKPSDRKLKAYEL